MSYSGTCKNCKHLNFDGDTGFCCDKHEVEIIYSATKEWDDDRGYFEHKEMITPNECCGDDYEAR